MADTNHQDQLPPKPSQAEGEREPDAQDRTKTTESSGTKERAAGGDAPARQRPSQAEGERDDA